MKPRPTRQSVFTICDELLLQNHFPDNERLISIAGGTMEIIAPLRDAWWSDLLARVEGSELLIQALERILDSSLRIREHVGAGGRPARLALDPQHELLVKLREAEARASRAECQLDEERRRSLALLQGQGDRHLSQLTTIVNIKDLACAALRASDRALLDSREAERARLIATVDRLNRELASLQTGNPIDRAQQAAYALKVKNLPAEPTVKSKG